MKKLISIILAASICLSLVACGTESQSDSVNSGDEPVVSETISDDTPEYNAYLLTALENAVNTAQPGTAGSSLKTVYAARDLLRWLKENKPDIEEIAATVEYLFENSEYADEAAEAFETIESVFKTLLESDTAQQLLDMVQMKMSELDLSDEVMQYVDRLFAEIDKYTRQSE